MHVAREGVTLALSVGIASPIFEGDSVVVVAAIKRARQDYSNVGTIVEDVNIYRNRFLALFFNLLIGKQMVLHTDLLDLVCIMWTTLFGLRCPLILFKTPYYMII
ncbi:unnamed protein product [Prunus brigantina]